MSHTPDLPAAIAAAEEAFTRLQAHYRAIETTGAWERERRFLQAALESAWADVWAARSALPHTTLNDRERA